MLYAYNAELSPLISTLQSKRNCQALVNYTVVRGLKRKNACAVRSGLGVIVELLSHISLIPYVTRHTRTPAASAVASLMRRATRPRSPSWQSTR